jgi:hypothetical protein
MTAMRTPKEIIATAVKDLYGGHLTGVAANQIIRRLETAGWDIKPHQGVSEGAHWDFCARTIDAEAPCNCLPPYAQLSTVRAQGDSPEVPGVYAPLEQVRKIWLDWREKGIANAIGGASACMAAIGRIVEPDYPINGLREAPGRAATAREGAT